MKRVFATALVLISTLSAAGQEIHVDARQVIGQISRHLTGECIEDVNHEIYGGLYSQMIFGESFQEPVRKAAPQSEVSGMWRPVQRGMARGRITLVTDKRFVGKQAQQIIFESGDGDWGVENQGLNRWGMNFVACKPYEGYVWVRAEKPTAIAVSLENRDGSKSYAAMTLHVIRPDWQRLDFTLTPSAADRAGRFAVTLKQPGSVTIGHAFLQPGAWGRFKGLPVRRNVAEGMIDQGVTVLRYGGSMVNTPEYRWKNMIGPRDRRPPYRGHWYPYSSNGWGILDFMEFCEAAGFEYIPAIDINETPQDLADFIEYAKGSADSPWGRKRAADGHSKPYRLPYLELGNEERVDDKYAGKFEAAAKAIWAKDKDVILVVGDFAYNRPITDPMKIAGADSRITSLAGHAKILELARQNNREVWFDVHLDTNGPGPSRNLNALPSYIDALGKIANGARHKVVVFELNAGNHAVRRALANALAIGRIERDGRVPIVTSANGLQPDGQNDNGWDQGLLFLNPAQVWLQPPGHVSRMISRNYLPQALKCDATDVAGIEATARRDAAGTALVLQVVNLNDRPITATIRVDGFDAGKPAEVTELSGRLDAVNTAQRPDAVVSKQAAWTPEIKDGRLERTFAAYSFTIIRW